MGPGSSHLGQELRRDWEVLLNFEGLDRASAREFAERFLPAWTGNDPERLADFYHPDGFYLDPAIPDGVQGREAILAYFRKLLAYNPDWIWTHEDGVPLENGFLNKWKAEIPVGSRVLVVRGVCSIQLREGLIVRNEVYFDRTELMAAIKAHRLAEQV